VVVALVENNQMSDETGKAATVDYLLKVPTFALFFLVTNNELLQMLKSPCEDVVKLALSGLDRIVFKTEVAVYAVRVFTQQTIHTHSTRTTGTQDQHNAQQQRTTLHLTQHAPNTHPTRTPTVRTCHNFFRLEHSST
jgi:hypothetical protein